MEFWATGNLCSPPRSRVSTRVVLFSILSTLSYAQLISTLASQNSTPTVFPTSQLPSPSFVQTQSPTGTNSPPPTKEFHVFDFYFLILAFFVILVCCGLLWIMRRKKRKEALIASNGRIALARDVESWRARFGIENHTPHAHDREDGLDETGEAPPPYVPGPKPPSMRIENGLRAPRSLELAEHAEVVQFHTMAQSPEPPNYHKNAKSEPDSGEIDTSISRPVNALTIIESYIP
jgi:cbb3-type cytochrome oxidase subunit 3